jgi:hypothetical protein
MISPMSNGDDFDKTMVYKIRLKERLEGKWSEWLEGMTISYEGDGKSVLTGSIKDQPALHGLLIKIRDLGLTLITIEVIGEEVKMKLEEDSENTYPGVCSGGLHPDWMW